MGARMGALYEEHLLLGARFLPNESTGLLAVRSYPCEGEKDLDEALFGAVVADLTGTTYALLSGDAAPDLARSALAGRPLSVGEASFEAVLRGDGSVLGAPLVLRTGDHEHVLVDPTPRGEAAVAWLELVRGAGGDEGPLRDCALEDASGMLVPLLCAGKGAGSVVSDYLSQARLPRAGEVASVRLDAIPALLAHVPVAGCEAYLLLVPAPSSRAIWRSLLSFAEVSPVGVEAVRELLARSLPWAAALSAEGPVALGRAELEGWGIVRDGDDFVGARGLAS